MKEYKYNTINDGIKDLNIIPKYKQYNTVIEDSVYPDKILALLLMIENIKNKDIENYTDDEVEILSEYEYMVKKFKEDNSENFLYLIFFKRLELIKDKYNIPEYIFLFINIFKMSTPGEVVLFMISLLDIIDTIKKDITVRDVVFYYINGWYDKTTITEIIDKILKPKLCKNSWLY